MLPPHCAKTYSIPRAGDILQVVTMEILTAGLIWPPDTWLKQCTMAANERPNPMATWRSWVWESCMSPESVPFFHGKVVIHARNTKKNVAKHSAITDLQNSIVLSSPLIKTRGPLRLHRGFRSSSMVSRLQVQVPSVWPEGWSNSDSIFH